MENLQYPGNPKGLLTVTFINGVLNVLRLLIENNKVSTVDIYKTKLKNINNLISSNLNQANIEKWEKLFIEEILLIKNLIALVR